MRLGLGAALFSATVGCAGVERIASPVSPTDPRTLIVRVHERTTETPITNARVQHGTALYYTNHFGESAVPVAATRETTITVSAAGYEEMSASGLLNRDERWTFFLVPVR